MTETKRVLTLDANIFVAAIKGDEQHRKKCQEIIGRVSDSFLLAEPSILYQEVCGTIARKIGVPEARSFASQLDRMIPEDLLFSCDRELCLGAYSLCSEYSIYAIDAIYLSVAIGSRAVLVSLDREDFISKLAQNRHNVETYHVSDFPY